MAIEKILMKDVDPVMDLTLEAVIRRDGGIEFIMEDPDYDTGFTRSINLSNEDVIKLGEWLLRNKK